MPDDEARLWHEAAQLLGDRLDGQDAIVQVVDLPAAIQLAQDGVAHQLLIISADVRDDRQALQKAASGSC